MLISTYDLHSTINQILFYKLNALKTTKSITFKIKIYLTDDNVLVKLNASQSEYSMNCSGAGFIV